MSCTDCDSTDIYCKNKCIKCYGKEYKKTEKGKKVNEKYNESQKGIKNRIICGWRRQGLIESDTYNYEKIYQRYLDTTHCDLCNVELTEGKTTTSTTKQMEHCHITGLFRNIVCCKCNGKIRDKETPSKTNTGIKNITYNKSRNDYHYNKMVDGERYQKNFKTIGGALAHKIIHNVLLNRSI